MEIYILRMTSKNTSEWHLFIGCFREQPDKIKVGEKRVPGSSLLEKKEGAREREKKKKSYIMWTTHLCKKLKRSIL